jgi:hypothetical protein
MNEQLKKRLKSLFWRIGGMALAVLLEGVAQMLSDGTINLPVPYVVLLGLVISEITKYLNTATEK